MGGVGASAPQPAACEAASGCEAASCACRWRNEHEQPSRAPHWPRARPRPHARLQVQRPPCAAVRRPRPVLRECPSVGWPTLRSTVSCHLCAAARAWGLSGGGTRRWRLFCFCPRSSRPRSPLAGSSSTSSSRLTSSAAGYQRGQHRRVRLKSALLFKCIAGLGP